MSILLGELLKMPRDEYCRELRQLFPFMGLDAWVVCPSGPDYDPMERKNPHFSATYEVFDTPFTKGNKAIKLSADRRDVNADGTLSDRLTRVPVRFTTYPFTAQAAILAPDFSRKMMFIKSTKKPLTTESSHLMSTDDWPSHGRRPYRMPVDLVEEIEKLRQLEQEIAAYVTRLAEKSPSSKVLDAVNEAKMGGRAFVDEKGAYCPEAKAAFKKVLVTNRQLSSIVDFPPEREKVQGTASQFRDVPDTASMWVPEVTYRSAMTTGAMINDNTRAAVMADIRHSGGDNISVADSLRILEKLTDEKGQPLNVKYNTVEVFRVARELRTDGKRETKLIPMTDEEKAFYIKKGKDAVVAVTYVPKWKTPPKNSNPRMDYCYSLEIKQVLFFGSVEEVTGSSKLGYGIENDAVAPETAAPMSKHEQYAFLEATRRVREMRRAATQGDTANFGPTVATCKDDDLIAMMDAYEQRQPLGQAALNLKRDGPTITEIPHHVPVEVAPAPAPVPHHSADKPEEPAAETQHAVEPPAVAVPDATEARAEPDPVESTVTTEAEEDSKKKRGHEEVAAHPHDEPVDEEDDMTVRVASRVPVAGRQQQRQPSGAARSASSADGAKRARR
jgi:hypothetical protein